METSEIVDAVQALIDQGNVDPLAIREVSWTVWEITPFYCPDCQLNYCGSGTPSSSSTTGSTTAPRASAPTGTGTRSMTDPARFPARPGAGAPLHSTETARSGCSSDAESLSDGQAIPAGILGMVLEAWPDGSCLIEVAFTLQSADDGDFAQAMLAKDQYEIILGQP
jgi:hypothetical protein